MGDRCRSPAQLEFSIIRMRNALPGADADVAIDAT
jgi:hypothetical protein